MEKQLFTLKRQKELVKINRVLAFLVVALAFSTGLLLAISQNWIVTQPVNTLREVYPYPRIKPLTVQPPSQNSLTDILSNARYDRVIKPLPLTMSDVTHLVWSAQGKITEWGERTVPSYKSAFPLELIILVRNVSDMNPGLYRFDAPKQELRSVDQPIVSLQFPETYPALIDAPLVIGVSTKQTPQETMTWNEAGALAQNLLLTAQNLKLATFLIPTSGLPTELPQQLVGSDETLLWLMPFGSRSQEY